MAGKAYTGRLAFDPETGFHTEMVEGKVNVPVELEDGTWGNAVEARLVPGKRVVTDDEGKTWRYATADDSPHNDRYATSVLSIDGTDNRMLELRLEYGRVKAEEMMREEQPHHFEVQPDDPHYGGAGPTLPDGTVGPAVTKLTFDPDHIAEKITSHTEANQ